MTSRDTQPFPIVAWLARRPRHQVALAAAGLALYVGFRILRWLAAVQLDRWWLDAVTDAPVWRTRVGAQVFLAGTAGVVTIVVGYLPLRAAQRSPRPPDQPTFRPIAVVAGRFGPLRDWATWALPLYLCFRTVPSAAMAWEEWVLFRNGSSLGVDAPGVGGDIGYHLFTLPFLQIVFVWLSGVGLTIGVAAWALMVLNGSIRLPIGGRKSSIRSVRILSLIGAAWLTVQALNLWFVRYPALASSRRGRFDGAGFAEMHSDAIGYRPVAIACIVSAIVLLGVAVGRARVRWAVAAIGATAVAYLAICVALTPAIQRLVVNPSAAERERPYVADNLEATQSAYGIDATTTPLELTPVAPTDVDPTRLPLFEQSALAEPFQALQGTRATRIVDVDLDRYSVDGTDRPVYVAARSAAASELPESGWVNRHLVYTHGDGVVAALADTTTESGALSFTGLQDELGAADADLYFGENLDGWFVFTSTDYDEYDGAEYSGSTGVGVGSRWRQMVAGFALGDRNTALTSEFTDTTELLYRRSVVERITSIAPFLAVDGDPYPVITSSGVVWMADTYVTASTYPYAQHANVQGLPERSGLNDRPDANYVRHAAVATVDASTGEVSLYRTAPDEPIADTWSAILPGLFRDIDELPAELAAHRRYPTDAFTVQTNMLGQYHASDAQALFTGNDSWLVSPTLVDSADGTISRPSPATWQFVDELGGGWATVRPFSPGQTGNPNSLRQELAALAVGDHDSAVLTVYQLLPGTAAQLPSPQVAQSVIAGDPEISQTLTLLNANDSTVQFGPNTPLIQDGSLMWFRTIVVQSSSSVATPRLYSELIVSASGVETVDETKP